MVSSPKVRLIVRAVLAGVAALVASLQANPSYDKAALVAAVTAGAWAAIEVLTPVNGLVGHFKS